MLESDPLNTSRDDDAGEKRGDPGVDTVAGETVAEIPGRERRRARRVILLCLGLTVIPMIITAALLARDQLDNSGPLAQAESAQGAALQDLNRTQAAQAYDAARVSTTENQLNAELYGGSQAPAGAGSGPIAKSLQTQLSADEQELVGAETQYQIALHKYNLALAATAAIKASQDNWLGRWIVYSGVAGAVAIGDVLFVLYVSSDRQRDIENRAIVRDIAESTAQLDAASPDPAVLWIANERRLAGYHQLVLNYASSSRAAAKFTLLFGFLFVIAVSICALFAHTLASTVASSVVATVAAAVTGFVSQAVLRNAENSSKEVLSFFSHPLEAQRFLTAQQIAATMSGETQQEAKLLIIRELVRGGSPHDHALVPHGPR